MSRLPENCPVCGGKIEKGLLSAKSKDGTVLFLASAKPTEILTRFRFGESEAVKCLNCNLVILSYVKEVEHRSPLRDRHVSPL